MVFAVKRRTKEKRERKVFSKMNCG